MKALIQGSNVGSIDITSLREKGENHTAWQYCLKMAVLLSCFFALELSAQAISPEMLEQFQKMPRAQQEAIARQYGIDLDQFSDDLMQIEDSELAMPGEPLEQPTVEAKDESPAANESQPKQSPVKVEEKIKRYGLALFDGEVSTFAPTDDASVPDNYRLDAGDNLVIQLSG